MNWLRQLFSRRRIYNDLSAEIREHLEEKIEELVASGISRAEATRLARREFGNVTLLEERSREIWQWPHLLKISQYRDGVRRAEACKMDLSYPVGVTIFCNT